MSTENIKDAIKLCLEARSALGMPLTIESRQVEVPARCLLPPALSGRGVVKVFESLG